MKGKVAFSLRCCNHSGMRVHASAEIARGIFVTFFGSVGGALLGAAALGLNPLGGLSLVPITLFGSCTVLLPTYLWCRDRNGASQRSVYLTVLLSGAIGGAALIAIILLMFGASLIPAANVRTGQIEMSGFRIYGLGALFGCSTAVCWLFAHHLTRSRSDAKGVR